MKTSSHRPRLRVAFAALTVAALGLMFLPVVVSHAEPPAVETGDGARVLTFSENEVIQTVDAKGRDVTINGNNCEITVQGECRLLAVNGNNNRVAVETVTVIVVPGNKNQVTWSKVASGEQPQVTNLGNGNTVARRDK